ncbi:MAG: malate dehydrogenase [Candidatus Omnitrophica bacterium]|jgi:malate dehydrogenase|nr:malate dehydrogenase [Candidatus Omnitrophota bacterium]MDD5079130.1 malate dehydrogenase [Candidatus Omnitrophota bacterium]
MKISIIGAGNVGGTAALRVAQENIGDVVLIDVVPGMAKGKGFDLADSRWLAGKNYQLTGTDDINGLKGSDIVVITAGLARKPGMTREDLLNKNSQILKSVCVKVKELAANAVVIIVTNPLDVMTYFAVKTLEFLPGRVFGMGVTLDASRFANLISEKLSVAATDIQPVVVGCHGEGMLPLARFTRVKNKALTEIITDKAAIAELLDRTVDRGKEIVSLLGSGSAYYAPSAAICQLVKAVAKDEKLTLGVSAYLNGEYGLKDITVGVPCLIGRFGVEKVVELDLNPEERSAFVKSAESIRQLTKTLAF